jgi:hypothetical protein
MKKLFVINFLFAVFLVQPVYAQVTFSDKTDSTTGDYPMAVSIGDLNGDGKPDLAVANGGSTSVSVLLNTTTPGAITLTFTAKTDFITGGQPFSISMGDFNGDGKPDLAVVNIASFTVSVLLNTTIPGAATPTFTAKTDFATGNQPSFVSIGDLNGDGKSDLVVTNMSSKTVSVFLNATTPGSATPTFLIKTDFATGTDPSSVSIGDFNGDGKPDLAIANYSDSVVSVLLNTTTPGSATPTFLTKTDFATGGNPYSVSIEDMNGDGRSDLVVTNSNSSIVSVLLNTTIPGAAAPTFLDKKDFMTGSRPYSVSIGDFNGDGKPDLAVANYNVNTVSVLLNTTTPGSATPTFLDKKDFTTGASPHFVSIGDLNGDGKRDLAVSNYSDFTVSVLLNTTIMGAATPAFSVKSDSSTGNLPYSVSIGDLNGDGKSDLAVANYGSASVSVLLNTTSPGADIPTFTTKTDFTADNGAISVTIGEFNGDGKPDLAVANANSTSVSVLLNTTSPGADIPTFSTKADFTTGGTPYSVSIADLNGDGKLDLATANLGSNNISVFLNTTTPGNAIPTFSTKTDFTAGTNPISISICDLNGDGMPDLAAANFSANTVSVFLNTTLPGALIPTFSAKSDFAAGANPQSVSVSDLNGDGKTDLVTADYNNNYVSVLLNNTDPGASIPVFSNKTDFATGGLPYCVSIGDLSGDGKPDLAVANYFDNSISVLINTTGPGASVPAFSSKTDFETGENPQYVSIGDLNGDGNLDLVSANYFANTVSILLNEAILPVGVKNDISLAPVNFGLAQNYPNPFNPSTKILFILAHKEHAKLVVYNLLGQPVKSLFDGVAEKQKEYSFDFNASHLTSGVYFYKIQTPTRIEVRKMLLIK